MSSSLNKKRSSPSSTSGKSSKIPRFTSHAATSSAFLSMTKSQPPVYNRKQQTQQQSTSQNNKSTSESSSSPDTTTTNGAMAYSSTGCSRLDLFFSGLVRNSPQERIEQQMDASWKEQAEHAVQLLMHARDCRAGKGEKQVVMHGLMWLRQHKPATYLLNLAQFLQMGYFKDLLVIAEMVINRKLPSLFSPSESESGSETTGTASAVAVGADEPIELHLFCEYLQDDYNKFQAWQQKQQQQVQASEDEGEQKQDSEESEDDNSSKRTAKKKDNCSISLAAKWAPTEGCHFDRTCKAAKRMAGILFGSTGGDIFRQYRVMLSTLRSHLNIVERLMCNQESDNIKFEHVPAKAQRLLRKAFQKHQADRYKQYLESVKSGKTKINVKGTQPHELASGYILQHQDEDATIEAQWTALIDDLKGKGGLSKALAVVDVSGSMASGSDGNVSPMAVAIALGLIVAELTTGPYHNRVITFSNNPQLHQVQGSSLKDKCHDVKDMEWGGSTNMEATFDLILQTALDNNVPASEMPSSLFIFSDMQFNQAVDNSTDTIFQNAKSKYEAAGYVMPQVIFWNLNGKFDSSAPVNKDENGVCLLSGYSAELMKFFLDGVDFANPIVLMLAAIDKYPVLIFDQER